MSHNYCNKRISKSHFQNGHVTTFGEYVTSRTLDGVDSSGANVTFKKAQKVEEHEVFGA